MLTALTDLITAWVYTLGSTKRRIPQVAMQPEDACVKWILCLTFGKTTQIYCESGDKSCKCQAFLCQPWSSAAVKWVFSIMKGNLQFNTLELY